MQKVLIVGVITLPILMFLVIFSNNVLDDADANATSAKSEADKLMDTVTNP